MEKHKTFVSLTVYNGKSNDDSTHYIRMVKEIALPFVPFIGLELFTPAYLGKIEAVSWSLDSEAFACRSESQYLDSYSLDEFDKLVKLEHEGVWNKTSQILSCSP